MASDFGGNGLEAMTELVELDHDAAQAVGLSVTSPVPLNDRTELGPSVEGGAAEPDPGRRPRRRSEDTRSTSTVTASTRSTPC